MKDFQFIKSMPGQDEHIDFEKLPSLLYQEDSMRFKLGHEPVNTHLEGCYVMMKGEEPVGRFSFYENPGLNYEQEPAACIGSYECINNQEAAQALLKFAKDLASSKGYTWLVGPMEGSTWNSYRFSLHNNEPNFFMEPYHHVYYNNQFIHAGFHSLASYVSNQTNNINYDEERLNRVEEQYKEKGASFRNLDMSNLELELNKIGALSLSGFAHNFLYTPIEVADFVTKYKALENYFDPELVWIVENQQQETQAFIFAIRNYFDPTGESLIIKSLVRDKETPFKGVGSYLTSKITQIASQRNFKRIIHAYMINTNESVNISGKHDAEVLKSYALYGVKL